MTQYDAKPSPFMHELCKYRLRAEAEELSRTYGVSSS